MNKTGIVIILLCFLAAAAVVLWERRKTRKTMEEIERMLDAAMTGSFSETNFDESRLSALETKFAHYLSAAEASSRNVAQDTDAFAVFDFKWTEEALANIVDNAIKYTEHGTITISAVSYEMFARIDISDTGSGIPETEQAKIFARFYRSNSVQKQEGVGIGLYLARQIISGEGGYIKVASVPGKGSTFSIFLPK